MNQQVKQHLNEINFFSEDRWGDHGTNFRSNKSSSKHWKRTSIDSYFYADSEYHIRFNQTETFPDINLVNNSVWSMLFFSRPMCFSSMVLSCLSKWPSNDSLLANQIDMPTKQQVNRGNVRFCIRWKAQTKTGKWRSPLVWRRQWVTVVSMIPTRADSNFLKRCVRRWLHQFLVHPSFRI